MFGLPFLTRFLVYGFTFIVFLVLLYFFVIALVKGTRIFFDYMRRTIGEETSYWKSVLPRRKNKKD